MNRDFSSLVQSAWNLSSGCLCVGLDPDPSRMPEGYSIRPDGVLAFCQEIVNAVAPYVCAFKPNHAHFAALGLETSLQRLIEHIHATWPDVPVLLDAKRNDIGSTAVRYASEVFERYEADAVTVNPYLGWDTVEPFLEHDGKGVAVLCKTSNPGAGWLQDHTVDDPLFLRVAEQVHKASNPNLLMVAGATDIDSLARVRQTAPSTTLLVPGVGAQGGSAEQVLEVGRSDNGYGLIVNSSRGVLYASENEDFVEAAATEARRLNELLKF